jgi:hypothetical protein
MPLPPLANFLGDRLRGSLGSGSGRVELGYCLQSHVDSLGNIKNWKGSKKLKTHDSFPRKSPLGRGLGEALGIIFVHGKALRTISVYGEALGTVSVHGKALGTISGNVEALGAFSVQ